MAECEGLALVTFARNEIWQDDQGGLARVVTSQLHVTSESRHFVKMNPNFKKLTILFLFQLSLFTTLECMFKDEEAIFLWHWQQLCCMTLALHRFKLLHGDGNDDCGPTREACTNLVSSI